MAGILGAIERGAGAVGHALDPRTGQPDPLFTGASRLASAAAPPISALLGPSPTNQQRGRLQQQNSGLLHSILHALGSVVSNGYDARENDFGRIHQNLVTNGVHPQDAQRLAEMASGLYTGRTYNDPRVQASTLALMKQLGYVPHQAL